MLKKFDSIQKILSQVKNFELADRIGKHKWRGQNVSKKLVTLFMDGTCWCVLPMSMILNWQANCRHGNHRFRGGCPHF